MAASAVTERAAPRWVSWRSILSAMVRSCSITTTWSGRSGSGATCRSTSRSPGLRGVDEIDLVFVDRGAARAHLLDQRQQRAAERHQIAQRCAGAASAPTPRRRLRPRHWRRRSCRRRATMMTGCGSALSTASAVPERQRRHGLEAGSCRRLLRSGEGVEGLDQPVAHGARIVLRSARSARCAFERVGGGARRLRPRHRAPSRDACGRGAGRCAAVMRQHLVVERGDQRELRRRAAARVRARPVAR